MEGDLNEIDIYFLVLNKSSYLAATLRAQKSTHVPSTTLDNLFLTNTLEPPLAGQYVPGVVRIP